MQRDRTALVRLVLVVLALATAGVLIPPGSSSASAKVALYWEPSAKKFWAVNHAAIWRLFDNGECTEWAALKRWSLVRRIIESRISYELRHHQPEIVPNMDARYWAAEAQAVGIPTGSRPSAGALVVFQPGLPGVGSAGHIAYVQRVAVNGSFLISEMNAPVPYRVTYQLLPPSIAQIAGVRFICRASAASC